MLLVIFGVTWCLLAEAPPQLLLLAVAILLRVLYVTGRRPYLPRDLIAFWVLATLLGFLLAPSGSREGVLMVFCDLTLLGTLFLHVGQQTASSGVMQRIPIIRHVALFFSRYLVLGRREIGDMNFWSQQNLRAIRVRHAARPWFVRNAVVTWAYLASRLKIVTCLLHDARSLVEKWHAVLSARGGLPDYKLAMLMAKEAPRAWYADILADVALCLLLLLPLTMGTDALIPGPVLQMARAAAGVSS